MTSSPHPNRVAQQETEERHIRQFLSFAGIGATPEFRDGPDAVVVTGGRGVAGKRIGIEHRELTEEDLAANRPNLSWLVDELRREQASREMGEDVSVGIGLDAAAPQFRKRTHMKEMVVQLAALAAEHVPGLNVGAPVDFDLPELHRTGLANLAYLRFGRMRHGRGRDGPDVFVTPGFWGPGESSAIAAVQLKEKKLAGYRASGEFDEVWLLLVTGDDWVQATDSVLTEGRLRGSGQGTCSSGPLRRVHLSRGPGWCTGGGTPAFGESRHALARGRRWSRSAATTSAAPATSAAAEG